MPPKRTRGLRSRYVLAVVLLAFAVAAGSYYLNTRSSVQISESPPSKPTSYELKHIHGLVLDSTNPRVLYVATHFGVYRLEDDSGLMLLGADKSDLMGFIVHPFDSKIMYASGHSISMGLRNIGFARSSDGGLTWKPIALVDQVDFHALTISRADPRVLYGWDVLSNRLYRTQDGGATWMALDAKGLSGVISLAAGSKYPNLVLAGTDQGLLKSVDGGLTWSSVTQMLSGSAIMAVAVDPTDDDIIYASSYDRGLLKAVDGGKTWTKAEGLSGVIGHVAVDPSNAKIVYAAELSDHIYKSVDGGRSFKTLR